MTTPNLVLLKHHPYPNWDSQIFYGLFTNNWFQIPKHLNSFLLTNIVQFWCRKTRYVIPVQTLILDRITSYCTIIGTYKPLHPVIAMLASHLFEDFPVWLHFIFLCQDLPCPKTWLVAMETHCPVKQITQCLASIEWRCCEHLWALHTSPGWPWITFLRSCCLLVIHIT